jgi:hypothetical protein
LIFILELHRPPAPHDFPILSTNNLNFVGLADQTKKTIVKRTTCSPSSNMNILSLLAFLGLLSVSLANGGRGHDKKCKEGSTMCITLGQPVVEVCDNGHYTRLWMCPADFWCSESPEAHCAGMYAPSKQCSECDMTMHKCLKVSVLESGGRGLRI